MSNPSYVQDQLGVVGDDENDIQSKQTNGENPNSKQSHHRKRKKQYFSAIRQQMEFYFGDANLSKDRFLKNLIAANPCKYKYFMNDLNANTNTKIYFYCRCSVGNVHEIQ